MISQSENSDTSERDPTDLGSHPEGMDRFDESTMGRLSRPPESLVRVQLPMRPATISYWLLGITISVYILQLISEFLTGYDYPALLGLKVNEYIQGGEYWRLITPVFLHGSPLHIGFNMYALYVIGRGLERYYGHLRFLMLYLLAAFSGNVFSFVLSPKASLGASTAIFGLIAAEGIFIYTNRFLFGKQARSMLTNVIGIVAINLIMGLSPGIDNWGHLGGLIGGLAFAWFAGPRYEIFQTESEFLLKDRTRGSYAWLVACIVVFVFTLIAVLRY